MEQMDRVNENPLEQKTFSGNDQRELRNTFFLNTIERGKFATDWRMVRKVLKVKIIFHRRISTVNDPVFRQKPTSSNQKRRPTKAIIEKSNIKWQMVNVCWYFMLPCGIMM